MSKTKFLFNKSLSNKNIELFVIGVFKGQKLDSVLNIEDRKKLDKAIDLEKYTGDFNKSICIYGDGAINRIYLIGLGDKKKFNCDKLRSISSNTIRRFNNTSVTSMTIDSKSFLLNKEYESQSFTEGLILGSYEFNEYKSKKNNKTKINSFNFIGNCKQDFVLKGSVVADSVNFCRDLGNHPPNIQTPTVLANEALKISKANNMKSIIIDVSDFEKMGLGAFYGVARGSTTPAKMIIVEYNGANKSQKPIALVGKGLTFDTGGISLKPPPRMDEMKFDMCGGATVFGVMKAVSQLQPKLNIIFAIGATENMPDGDAQRPGDIVKAYNGKTIEVLNTDAEGRLVLADVLSYTVEKYQPSAIIDFATLTGAVLVALGDRASGIMGNNDSLINKIKESSNKTGEKAWELPLWEEYSKDIKSNIADIKNLGRSRLAGTIAAGVFLKEFVSDTPWVHMDIAGTAWGPKEPSYLPKNGATGVAVRLICDFIEQNIK